MTKVTLVASLAFAFTGQVFSAPVTINTNNGAAIAAFQVGASVETFESLTGQNTLTDGTAIAVGSQLDNQLKASKGIFFTSGGNTPIAVIDVTGLGTAASGKNVVAPLEINTDLLCAASRSCFMEIFFTGAMNKFGGWFNNSDASALVFWTDNTLTTLDVSKGNFTGVVDTARTIDHVTLFLKSNESLTIDDITYGGATSTVPEPSTAVLLGLGLGVAALVRKKLA